MVLSRSCTRGTGETESERLLSIMPVDAALYEEGAYALYRQAKAEGVVL
jgi:hypothetical protein